MIKANLKERNEDFISEILAQVHRHLTGLGAYTGVAIYMARFPEQEDIRTFSYKARANNS